MTTKEALIAAKKIKKEADRIAATLSTKEYHARMLHLGYKKVGIFLMADKIRQLRIIADAKSVTLFQLVDEILAEYLENFKNK